MNESDKAKELVEMFKPYAASDDDMGIEMSEIYQNEAAKQCAILHCEQIKAMMHESGNRPEFTKGYWQSVIEQIKKM